MASTNGKAETINFAREEVYERLNAMTGGRGPDRCIDAVGCEADGAGGVDAVLDNVKATVKLATDRAHVIRQAIFCCRKGATVSVPGVYVGLTRILHRFSVSSICSGDESCSSAERD